MRQTIRYGLILSLICIVAGASLAAVYSITKPRIIAQAEQEERASLKEVLPEGRNFVPVKFKDDIIYYKVFDEGGKFIGVAFKAKGKGYSGTIETMAGMTKDGTITAIKILNQNETPGLGARIIEIFEDTTLWDLVRGKKKTEEKKPWFTEQFKDKKIESLKDILAISQATISSKAVIDSVRKKAQELKALIKNEP
jgi:electron transport complex protein RnfG